MQHSEENLTERFCYQGCLKARKVASSSKHVLEHAKMKQGQENSVKTLTTLETEEQKGMPF